MKLLDKYNKLQQEIYDYFGFKEGWHVYPINDRRDMFWCIHNDTAYEWGSKKAYDELDDSDSYSNEIITNSPMNGIYPGRDFTAILTDTHTDGNKFLDIFDNKKKVEWKDGID